MDGDQFDSVVRSIARRGSRRQAMCGLALALAAFAPGAAAARDRRHDQAPRPAAARRDGHTGLTGQVAGGTPVPPGRYPFAVSLHMRGVEWGFLCNGSLLDPSHVLTAAHCTIDPLAGTPFPPSAYTVVVGQVDRTTTHCAACHKRVTAIVVAPAMEHPHDVAVLTLDAPVEARIAQPIALINRDDPSRDGAGQRAIVAGWGLTTTGGSASPVLMEAPLTLLADAACGNDPATQLCTAIEGGAPPAPATAARRCSWRWTARRRRGRRGSTPRAARRCFPRRSSRSGSSAAARPAARASAPARGMSTRA